MILKGLRVALKLGKIWLNTDRFSPLKKKSGSRTAALQSHRITYWVLYQEVEKVKRKQARGCRSHGLLSRINYRVG
jgi:hypothetical protein